jgi:hypothetical protein
MATITKANRSAVIAQLNSEGHNLPPTMTTSELRAYLAGGASGAVPPYSKWAKTRGQGLSGRYLSWGGAHWVMHPDGPGLYTLAKFDSRQDAMDYIRPVREWPRELTGRSISEAKALDIVARS